MINRHMNMKVSQDIQLGYCWSRYANFYIVFGPNFGGGNCFRGRPMPSPLPPPVEESQLRRKLRATEVDKFLSYHMGKQANGHPVALQPGHTITMYRNFLTFGQPQLHYQLTYEHETSRVHSTGVPWSCKIL